MTADRQRACQDGEAVLYIRATRKMTFGHSLSHTIRTQYHDFCGSSGDSLRYVVDRSVNTRLFQRALEDILASFFGEDVGDIDMGLKEETSVRGRFRYRPK